MNQRQCHPRLLRPPFVMTLAIARPENSVAPPSDDPIRHRLSFWFNTAGLCCAKADCCRPSNKAWAYHRKSGHPERGDARSYWIRPTLRTRARHNKSGRLTNGTGASAGASSAGTNRFRGLRQETHVKRLLLQPRKKSQDPGIGREKAGSKMHSNVPPAQCMYAMYARCCAALVILAPWLCHAWSSKGKNACASKVDMMISLHSLT